MIEIKHKEDCCGCSACVEGCPVGCIAFREDGEGFLYPEVDKSRCTQCGRCERICPVLNPRTSSRSEARVLAAVNTDDPTRIESSSGGIFSLLAEETIGRGGVVFGARFDENFDVIHDGAFSPAELGPLRRSKYTQSRMGDCFIRVRETLREGRPVLFSGTGCQISGLKLFLGKEYDNLTTVEVACHGVPSPALLRLFLDGQRQKIARDYGGEARLTDMTFRDKTAGWKRYQVTCRYATPQGETVVSTPFYKNPFMRAFLHNLCLRPSCHACPVKDFRAGSDILLADYWGIEKCHPSMDDDKGTSLAITLTPKGEALLNAVSGKLRMEASSLAWALKGNGAIVHSEPRPKSREKFFKAVSREGLDAAVARYTKAPLKKRIRRKVRNLALKLGLLPASR